MDACNTGIVKLQELSNFGISVEYFSSDYENLLPDLNIFSVDTEEYSLNVNHKINDAKALKKHYLDRSFILRLRLQNIYVESFNWGLSKSD